MTASNSEVVPELESDDWFEIKGRGWVATFRDGHGLDKQGINPRNLVNRQVKIDGKEYRVRGVETYATLYYDPGTGFGLLIGAER